MAIYIPASFKVDDPAWLHELIERHSFATLITGAPTPQITHLPLLIDRHRGPHGTLIGHVARPNPHWQLDHAELQSVAVFHGPHAYISPSWYRSGKPAVPTWNYAVVHATGRLNVITDENAAQAILDRTVDYYEQGMPEPWQNNLEPELEERLRSAIVAFEMPIDRLDGKFKLGQNRPLEDREGWIATLESSPISDEVALTRLAREYLHSASRDRSTK